MERVATAIDARIMEALAAREYVVEGYLEASELYARFRLNGKRQDLKAAAQALCDTLERLKEDHSFFDALQAAVESAEETPVADIDAFLDQHFQILTALGLASAEAERLLDDFRYALDRVRQGADWRDMGQLLRRLEDLAKVTCEAARNVGSFRRRARATARLVRRDLLVGASLGTIVIDAAAFVHGHHHDPMQSIVLGLRGSLGD